MFQMKVKFGTLSGFFQDLQRYKFSTTCNKNKQRADPPDRLQDSRHMHCIT